MNSTQRVSKIVGITAGAFDMLHVGHVLMLCEASMVCDELIVLLQTDPSLDRPEKNKPIQSVHERQIQLSAIRYVDDILVYETEADLENILTSTHYDVRILGDEYKEKYFTGRNIPGHLGKCYFNSRNHHYSSSELRRRVFESFKTEQRSI